MGETIRMTDQIRDYLHRVGTRESDALRRCRLATESHPDADMMIAPEQAALLQMIVRIGDVESALEIGMFTGYSALAVALALPPTGRLIAIEVDAAVIEIARGHFAAAGVADRITIRNGPALDELSALEAEGHRFDLVFLDAEKTEYPRYYEASLRMLGPGGLIVADNMLWDGTVADPDYHSAEADTLRSLNEATHRDERVDACLVPVGDGMAICRVR